jgi:hypothetical protein
MDQGPNLLSWVAEEHHFACRDHVERLTAMYAQATAQYAVCAVEVANRVADGQPAAVPTSLAALPSDVLMLAQSMCRCCKFPTGQLEWLRRAVAWWRRRESDRWVAAADRQPANVVK